MWMSYSPTACIKDKLHFNIVVPCQVVFQPHSWTLAAAPPTACGLTRQLIHVVCVECDAVGHLKAYISCTPMSAQASCCSAEIHVTALRAALLRKSSAGEPEVGCSPAVDILKRWVAALGIAREVSGKLVKNSLVFRRRTYSKQASNGGCPCLW